MKENRYIFLYFLLSFFMVSLGQPGWIGWVGLFASFCGFALFWASSLKFEKKSHRFLLGLIWFGGVQAVQLSWMTSIRYQGPYMLLVYAFLILWIGSEFGLLTLCVTRKLSVRRMLAISSFWVLMEWSRLFLVSGFSWNPVGMALGYHYYGLGLASIWGVYGLSFLVIWVNLWALKSLFLESTSKNRALWLSFATFPFLFGILHQLFQEVRFERKDPLSVVLVQTALLPEEKEPMNAKLQSFVSPVIQWERILNHLKSKVLSEVDLIVLPEAALPFGAYRPIYPLENVKWVWRDIFGDEAEKFLPESIEPLVKQIEFFDEEEKEERATNAYWAKAVSKYYNASVILGLDDHDYDKKETYNAAFHFHPQNKAKRYEKRILVPMGEYIPYEWCNALAKKFGVFDSFQPGREAKVFSECPVPMAISICYEETYSNIIRQNRVLGAELLVNITNDAWFPNSNLNWQHFEHGRIRAIENGVPIIRACNTGITGAIDSFGKTLGIFSKKNTSFEKISGAFQLEVPTNTYFTLYSLWGDGCVVALSLLFISFHFVSGRRSTRSKRRKDK